MTDRVKNTLTKSIIQALLTHKIAANEDHAVLMALKVADGLERDPGILIKAPKQLTETQKAFIDKNHGLQVVE